MSHIKTFDEYTSLNENFVQNPLAELFDEYETDVLSVGDFDLKYRGMLIEYVILDENGEIHFWAGNPDTDKYAEEIIMDDRTKSDFCSQILDLF